MPQKLIKALNETDFYIEKIYLNGGCYSFYKFLKEIYPSAKPYINQSKDHVVTMINGKLFDITGQVYGDYSPLLNEEISMCENWSFAKNNWLYKECANCEEPIVG